MPKDIDCIVCGSCVVDILVRPIPLESAIGRGKLLATNPIELATGGIVSNSGIAMSRFGMKSAAFSYVGKDQWAEVIRSGYQREGLDTSHLLDHPTAPTSTTAVLVDDQGERSFAHCVGAPKLLNKSAFLDNLDYFARSRTMLLGYYSLMPNLESDLAEIMSAIQDQGCQTALDAAGDGGTMEPLSDILPHLDIYFPSLLEARNQTGETEPKAMIEKYRDHGAKGIVGIKLGAQGAIASEADKRPIRVSAIPPPGELVDTTGAGDCFYAGLLTSLLRGSSLEQALHIAAVAGAVCVTQLGATKALGSFEDLLRIAAE